MIYIYFQRQVNATGTNEIHGSMASVLIDYKEHTDIDSGSIPMF